jgi:prevent-host-death family protein
LVIGVALMITLTIREMRAALTHLDKILATEGEVLVTKRGRPLARLVPVRPAGSMPSHADLRARMPRLTVPSEVLVRQDRDGR